MTSQPSMQDISLQEAVELSSVDSLFYSQFFFPKTARQESPDFHADMWYRIEHPANRYVSFEVFRGGAKTSLLRLFTSKRIAFGFSRTILYIGRNQAHAARSVEWLLRAVQFNKLWAQAFQLRQGSKWTGQEIDIYHGVDEVPIRVLAMGIESAIRGINIDDFRPDLIVGDDIMDDENAGTKEQRQKIEDLWFGAIYNSLAPRSEAPHAKMALLGTPLDDSDVNELCQKDPSWASVKYSIFDSNGASAWPQRWTTAELLEEKKNFINRNQLSIWLREYECTIVSGENSTFRREWLQYWDVLPEHMAVAMAIDPVPPPSDRELKMDLRDKDSECIAVVGRAGGKVYLLDYVLYKGHNPEWTISEFFRLVDRWRPRKVRVESVAYQRSLKWLLEKAMMERGRYVQIDDTSDPRKKSYRIEDALIGVCSNKQFFVHETHSDFIEQYTRYPKVKHDDCLEAVAEATKVALEEDTIEAIFDAENEMYTALPEWRAAP